jgi:hypothetical protein
MVVVAVRRPVASPGGPAAVPPTTAEPSIASSAVPPAPVPPPQLRPIVRPADSGRLAIDFRHHLKSGRLYVWVDDEVVLDEELDARIAKKVVGIPVRKGLVAQAVEVEPGQRRVKVQVRWDDNIKTETTAATFKPNATRTLQIRVSRVLGGLSLEWK